MQPYHSLTHKWLKPLLSTEKLENPLEADHTHTYSHQLRLGYETLCSRLDKLQLLQDKQLSLTTYIYLKKGEGKADR